MINLWRIMAALCMIVTAAAALINGSAVMSSLFLVELLITLSLAYVDISGGLKLARLFDLPILLTVRMALAFGVVPVLAILTPEKLDGRLRGNYDLVSEALLLVILGMVGFWAGCKVMHRRAQIKAKLVTGARSLQSTLAVAAGLYAIGFGCKVYLLQHQLFAYTASLHLYRNNLAGAQAFMFGASFATLGLLLICIEKFSHPSSRVIRGLFWGMALSECVWGLISGMKQDLLVDFLAIGAIATLCRGNLAKKWVLSAVVGLVLLYPFSNAYRAVVRGAGSNQVGSFAGAFAALGQASTAFGESIAEGGLLENGADLTMSRLDLLQYFGLALSLPNRAAQLQGEEQIWMIPLYPFIPRLIWPSKPVLDKGARFNEALGGDRNSSSTVPYIADCYVYGGAFGVLAGMFMLGLLVQRYANGVMGAFSKKNLFRYSVVLLFCFKIEDGVVDWWSLLIKTMVLVSVVEWLAYGSSAKRRTTTVLQTAVFSRSESRRSPFSPTTI